MLDNLYDNIGGKIKGLAKAMFIVEAIGAVITGIVLLAIDEDFILAGLLTLFCGPIIAWVSSWILYAFGELVEDVHAIRNKEGTTEEKAKRNIQEETKHKFEEKVKNETKSSDENKKIVVPVQLKNGKYECPCCGCRVKKGQEICLCFSELDWGEII